MSIMHSRRLRTALLGCFAAVVVAAGWTIADAQLVQAARIRPVPGVAPGAAGKPSVGGLHLPQNNRVNMTPYVFTDSANYRWDLYYNGYIANGTNNAYSGGMNIQINNTGIGGSNQAWLGKDNDELELNPMSVSGCSFTRRIKVYKDAPLARWLEIFENPTGQDVTINAILYNNHNWQINSVTTSSGANAFGNNDWAMAITTQGGNNVPSVLHIMCDKKSKVRPNVQMQSNSVVVRWTFTVPAKGTAILCSFESQNNVADHVKFMASFKPMKYLKDLPSSVRKCIVNYPSISGIEGLDLDRNESSDAVLLKRGDLLLGTITNDSFTVETFFGPMKIPAAKVVGMVPGNGKQDLARVLLADGQVICGQMGDQKLQIKPSTGGELKVPMDSIKQWAYRLSETRPEAVGLKGSVLALRTGDQLLFDSKDLKLDFHTRHGKITLNGSDLLEVCLDNPANTVHRAIFLNGSVLAGMLEPATLSVPIQLGSRIDVPRDLIYKMIFASEDAPNPLLAHLVLNNDDELYGRLTDTALKLVTEFGDVEVKPANVKAIKFDPAQPQQVVLTSWDGSVHRGCLQQKEMTFQVVPGPVVKIPVTQMLGLVQMETLPPEDKMKQVQQLVARLGAESYQDRQKATEELVKLGSGIIPCLRRYLKDNDPEVRLRINSVIEKLGGDKPADNQPVGPNPRVFMKGMG